MLPQKLQSNVVLAKHEIFRWTNSNKIRRFLRNQDEFDTTRAVDKLTKLSEKYRWILSADIQKVKYRWTDYRSVSVFNSDLGIFAKAISIKGKIWYVTLIVHNSFIAELTIDRCQYKINAQCPLFRR